MQRGLRHPDEPKFSVNHYIWYLATLGQSNPSVNTTCHKLQRNALNLLITSFRNLSQGGIQGFTLWVAVI